VPDLSVIVPTVDRIATARLLAARVRALVPDLNVECIVVAPHVDVQPDAAEGIRMLRDEGRGVYAAFRVGLNAASGEYVWFIGDDDYPLDAFRAVGSVLRGAQVDLIVAPVVMSSGRIYRPVRSLLLLQFLNWCQQGVIYRRRILMHYRFFRRMKVKADQYVNVLLRADRTLTVRFLSRPICVFGVDGLSGRSADPGYQSVRSALARRTLGPAAFFAFRALCAAEPLAKRVMRFR
jgi:glycosyltransferase involved in cell wall biosynthesis